MRVKIFNEKCMVLCLLFFSVLTVFVILANLPQDLQQNLKQDSSFMNKVFLPESDNIKKVNHNENHKHGSVPIQEIKQNIEELDILSSEIDPLIENKSVDPVLQKREAIKKVVEKILNNLNYILT